MQPIEPLCFGSGAEVAALLFHPHPHDA